MQIDFFLTFEKWLSVAVFPFLPWFSCYKDLGRGLGWPECHSADFRVRRPAFWPQLSHLYHLTKLSTSVSSSIKIGAYSVIFKKDKSAWFQEFSEIHHRIGVGREFPSPSDEWDLLTLDFLNKGRLAVLFFSSIIGLWMVRLWMPGVGKLSPPPCNDGSLIISS